jgi:DNA (cytosine-5)-methyltransferase 1
MMTAIDLFCGAGGLSLGLERSGFHTVAAVEYNQDACATYRSAFPKTEVLCADARSVSYKNWTGIDLIAGGPPCQPFSTGGQRRGRDDSRDLFPEFVRAVLEAKPRAFIIENVPGLASPGHRDYLKEILKPLGDLYSIGEPTVLNTADFGVPQNRKRLIIVGTRELTFKLPTVMSSRRVPAGAVLTREPHGEHNSSKVVYAKRPDLRPNPYHGQLFNGGGRAIDLTQPAPTVLAAAGGNKTHFIDAGDRVPAYHRHLQRGGKPRTGELPEARRLTVLESALLQTFPERMSFVGSRSSQYTQIGNAVPPAFAAAIGQELAITLRRRQRRTSGRSKAVAA